MLRCGFCYAGVLADEEELAVFGERPEAVFDDHLEVVGLVADGIHLRTDGVVVGDGALVDVGDAVGHAAGLGEFLYELFDALGALGDLLDEFQVTAREALGFFGGEDILHALHVLDELRLVVRGDGNDMVHREVAHDAGLDLHGLHVGLPFHLVAGLELLAVHDLRGLEHADGGFVEVVLEDLRTGLLDVESAALCLAHPFLGVAVAVEADGLAGPDVFAEHVDDGVELGGVAGAFGVLGLAGIVGDALTDALLEGDEGLGHRGVEGNHRRGAVG